MADRECRNMRFGLDHGGLKLAQLFDEIRGFARPNVQDLLMLLQHYLANGLCCGLESRWIVVSIKLSLCRLVRCCFLGGGSCLLRLALVARELLVQVEIFPKATTLRRGSFVTDVTKEGCDFG